MKHRLLCLYRRSVGYLHCDAAPTLLPHLFLFARNRVADWNLDKKNLICSTTLLHLLPPPSPPNPSPLLNPESYDYQPLLLAADRTLDKILMLPPRPGNVAQQSGM